MNKWKRAACGALALLMLGSTLVGCGKEEEIVVDKKIVSLPPEEQILTDKYRQNPAITENMVYTEDVATITYNKDKNTERSTSAYWKFFEVHDIQIDCMDLIRLGESTMGDITKIVDKANEDAINYAKESVRQARQEILDAEYEAEKRKAEKKAQDKGIIDFDFTITYPRPQADISDLSYVNPYSYYLAYPNTDGKTKAQYPYSFTNYEERKLIDPSKNSVLYLFIYKYDVPYVQCVFESVTGKGSSFSSNSIVKLYNNYIDQECDWVLTAIAPADCTFLVDQELVWTEGYTLPPYVDMDWRSKGAKSNMVTNGNIQFGGQGFTWDSLMTLCYQLKLTMNEGKVSTSKNDVTNNKVCTYTQTSDNVFTYYTIYLPINQFFKQKSKELVCPIATITVTFDRLTNNCVNWYIDYGRDSHCFPAETVHDIGSMFEIDVRNYKIDTTNYESMLATVDTWVKQNRANVDFGYFLVDSNGIVVGKIAEGLKNYRQEVVVGDTLYYCVKPPESASSMSAYYLSKTEHEKLVANNATQEEIIAASKQYFIICMAVTTDEKGNATPLGYFNNTGMLVDAKQNPSGYYIHSIDYDAQTGYKNAVIIDQDVYDNLLTMYIRTFKLSSDVKENLDTLYQEGDPWKMLQYMTQYVQINKDERDRIETEIGEAVDDITKNPLQEVGQGEMDIITITE